MSFYRTSIDAASPAARLAKKLQGIEGAYGGSTKDWIENHGLYATEFDTSLGTIGGGNHFAELCRVAEVRDPVAFESLGLTVGKLALLGSLNHYTLFTYLKGLTHPLHSSQRIPRSG